MEDIDYFLQMCYEVMKIPKSRFQNNEIKKEYNELNEIAFKQMVDRLRGIDEIK